MFFEKERGLPSSAADSLLVNGATALGSLSPDALQQQHLHIRATQPGSLSLASNASSVLSCHMQMTSANISSSLPRQHELQSGRAGSASSVQPTILRIRRRKRDDHETLDALGRACRIECLASCWRLTFYHQLSCQSSRMEGRTAIGQSREVDKLAHLIRI